MTVTPFDFLNAISALERPDGVIAFPTDTVYGLGCLPDKVQAIEKIYRIKGRSQQKPLILMSNHLEALQDYIGEMTLPQAARFQDLAKTYWPGALTIVVPKSSKVPPQMTQGMDTVGLRLPDCPFLSILFEMTRGGVLATTSANLSDAPDNATAAQVFQAFGNQVDFILMGDHVGSGQASTVVAVEADGGIRILRPGDIVLD